jgi:hypothetical protein
MPDEAIRAFWIMIAGDIGWLTDGPSGSASPKSRLPRRGCRASNTPSLCTMWTGHGYWASTTRMASHAHRLTTIDIVSGAPGSWCHTISAERMPFEFEAEDVELEMEDDDDPDLPS